MVKGKTKDSAPAFSTKSPDQADSTSMASPVGAGLLESTKHQQSAVYALDETEVFWKKIILNQGFSIVETWSMQTFL